MAFSYSPKIVTEGLVLYLDAANPYSYVSGSMVWNDISRGGNNGTLTNGPTFSSANNGSIVFDGTNDYVNCGSFTQLTTKTISVTFKHTLANPPTCRLISKRASTFSDEEAGGIGILDSSVTGNSDRLFVSLTNGVNASVGTLILSNSILTESDPPTVFNTWHTATAVVKNNDYIELYVDSILKARATIGNQATNSSNLLIGTLLNGGSLIEWWNGNIASIQIYNRALSASEILQNYNAQKSRFGLT